MKQGSVEADRFKSVGRYCFQRRKMLKNSGILNGDAENIDRTLARELNFAVAAAFHDHLSCTKSAQEFHSLDAVSNDILINNNRTCKMDHIYANCSENKNKTNVANIPSESELNTTKEVSEIVPPMDFTENQRKQFTLKKRDYKKLKTQLDKKRREQRMCLLRKKRHPKPSLESNKNDLGSQKVDCNMNYSPCLLQGNQHITVGTPVLATRYFGRRSKTVPSRALKRRYLGPPKTLPIKKEIFTSLPSSPVSPVSDRQESVKGNRETVKLSEIVSPSPRISKVLKKRGRKPKNIVVKRDHLSTNSEYFLPDNHICQDFSSKPEIDVPLWKLKPVTSFYQMEGTENINDPVFERRHTKCELAERRRKRWDMQRLRDQKTFQKLKLKNLRESSNGEENLLLKYHSFYPNPQQIEIIEVTDRLPVLAFGHVVPLFQPSEFSLPWSCNKFQDTPSTSCSKGRKGRPPSQGQKVT